ncbi:G5 domain-containing protein, partial [Streptococcus uberis]
TIPLGEEVIVETGSEGQIKVTTTTPTLNGVPNGEPVVTREVVAHAKAKVIRRGTGVVGQNVDVTYEIIPIPTQPTIIEDATIPLGEEVIVETGSEGQIKVTTTTPTLNGVPKGEPIVTREIVTQAKAKVIRRGTGVVGQNVDVTYEIIPIPTQPTIIEDATIPVGEEVIVDLGSEGQIKVTITTPTLNGVPKGEPIVTREVVAHAKAKVIRRGTGISSSNIDTIKPKITKEISVKKHEVNVDETIILPHTGFKHNHKQTYGLLSILLSLILFIFKSKRRTK